MKEFFKPTKWKIIIAFIIFLFIYSIPIVPCYSGPTTGEPGQRYVGTYKACSLGFLKLGSYYDYFGLKNSRIIGYFYLIIIAYLTSVIIVYLFLKRKKHGANLA